MAVAATASRPLSWLAGGAVGTVLGSIPAEAAVGAVAGGGTLFGVGAFQWLLLRGRVGWSARWPAASGLGGAAAAAGAFSLLEALPGNGFAETVLSAAVGFACWVAVFWVVLRQQLPGAMRLGAASAAAFLAAAVISAVAGALSGLEGAEGAFAALFGALYGAILLPPLRRWGSLPGKRYNSE